MWWQVYMHTRVIGRGVGSKLGGEAYSLWDCHARFGMWASERGSGEHSWVEIDVQLPCLSKACPPDSCSGSLE